MSSTSYLPSAWKGNDTAKVFGKDSAGTALGVVAAVDRDTGEITLVHRDGTQSHLTAPRALLQELRVWKVVHVITDGTRICELRCL
jgi:hypothetical protein